SPTWLTWPPPAPPVAQPARSIASAKRICRETLRFAIALLKLIPPPGRQPQPQLLLQLFFDPLPEALRVVGVTVFAAVDEQRRRRRDARGRALGAIFLHPRLHRRRLHVLAELGHVETGLLGVFLELGLGQVVLVGPQLLLVGPELPLPLRSRRRLGRQ